jgi:hypothetical protein
MDTSIIIESANTVGKEKWEQLWKTDKQSAYSQSYEWAEIWSTNSELQLQPAPVLFHFSDGAEILIPFSRQSFGGGIINRYVASIPRVTVGGWLSADDITAQHIILLQTYMKQHYKNVIWRLNPVHPLTGQCNIPGDRTNELHIVELCEDFDCVCKKIIAGSVCLYGQNNVAPWLGVFNRQYVPMRPMNYLYYSLIKQACENKLKWFDLGISRSEGVRSFKERFGAQPFVSPIIERECTCMRMFKKLRAN